MRAKPARVKAHAGARRGTARLVALCSGPIVWAAHLAIVYGAHTLLCARGYAGQMLLGVPLAPAIVVVATVAALLSLAGVMLAPRLKSAPPRRRADRDPPNSFEVRVMRLLALLSAIGVAWAGATAFIIAPCLALR
jgi:hypothetical protein